MATIRRLPEFTFIGSPLSKSLSKLSRALLQKRNLKSLRIVDRFFKKENQECRAFLPKVFGVHIRSAKYGAFLQE